MAAATGRPPQRDGPRVRPDHHGQPDRTTSPERGLAVSRVSHILFLAGGPGRNAISGAEHHVITLVQALAARGVDTELIVLLWQNDAIIEETLQRLQASGVNIVRIERRA